MNFEFRSKLTVKPKFGLGGLKAQIFKLSFAIILIGVAFNKLDINASIYLNASVPVVLLSFSCFAAWQLSLGLRWWYCLDRLNSTKKKPPMFQIMISILIGNLVSISVLPSIFGQDSVKLLKWEKLAENFTHAWHSVLVTRIAGILGTTLLGAVSFFGLVVLNISESTNAFLFEFKNSVAICGLMMAIITLSICRHIRKSSNLVEKRGLPHRLGMWILLDSRIVLLGILSQLLCIAAGSLALMSFGNIGIINSSVITGVSYLGRLVPLSFLGLTIGEGIQFCLLREIGWETRDIIAGISLPLIFLFISSVVGVGFEAIDVAKGRQIAKQKEVY